MPFQKLEQTESVEIVDLYARHQTFRAPEVCAHILSRLTELRKWVVGWPLVCGGFPMYVTLLPFICVGGASSLNLYILFPVFSWNNGVLGKLNLLVGRYHICHVGW